MESLPVKGTSIGAFARAHDVSLRTLRFYEERGLLRPDRDGVRRRYSARDHIRLGLILKGKRLGFTLTEIEALILAGADGAANGADAPALLGRQKIAEQIEALERQRDEVVNAIEDLKAAGAR